MNLDTPLQYLKGVGPKMAPKLERLAIKTAKDLIFYFPRTWLDLSKSTLIAQIRIGDITNIRAQITRISNQRSPKKRITITTAFLKDKAGETIRAIWFNQPFLVKNLRQGEEWNFYGKVEFDWQSREKILPSPIYEKNSAILPIYSETEGVTSRYLRRLIQTALTSLSLIDFLPLEIRQQEKLIELGQAIREIHFPSNTALLNQAKTRLAFEELLLIVLRMQQSRLELRKQGAAVLQPQKAQLVQLVKSLPYELTNAQRKTSWEIIQDMAKPFPMNRLLEGDVGSGKTVVAALAALNVVKNNYQVAWMAPTEILARQHYETACRLLKDFDVTISLVTSSKVTSNQEINPKSEIRNPKQIINSNVQNPKNLRSQKANQLIPDSDLIIGTHSLIQEGIKFSNLGLVIIDEQHRFGVKQRAALQSNKLKSYPPATPEQVQACDGGRGNLIPHYLSMTATPIPRSLALSIYGDLDLSILDEMPPGRQKIITRLVDPVNRQKAYDFIRQQIQAGQQVFVICPLIEMQNAERRTQNLFNLERKSVKKEYEKLAKEIFPDLKVAMLHGRLKNRKKEQIMKKFHDGQIDLLVSTSVVEVGVDVPNATIMMIEDAERFGLAQLHQFRGRVGRGQYQSYCLLFTNNLSPEIHKRLQALIECSDGFKLAEKDLQLRGPGELVGINQSGLPDLKMASLTDIILVKRARTAAEKIIKEGLDKYPLLQEKLAEFTFTRHLE